MKRNIFNLLKCVVASVAFLGTYGANAQLQIPNSSFENWDSLGTTNEEPVNWNSFMTANCTMPAFFCGYGQAQQVWRSNQAHSGNYSAMVVSRNAIITNANGNLTLGRINMGAPTAADPSNFNFTDVSDTNFNQIFTEKPDSLVFWVKFKPGNVADSAKISAIIHDNYNYRDPQDSTAGTHVVGEAINYVKNTNGSWMRIAQAFDYSGPATTPEYILINLTTNGTPGGGSDHDTLWVDDLEMIYNNPISISPTATQNLMVYQQGSILTANLTTTAAVPSIVGATYQWKYSTTAGGSFNNSISGATSPTYTPHFTLPGTYYVVCESIIGGNTYTSKEVKVVVSDFTVSIALMVAQNLVKDQPGDTLTVTEATPASAREWKYSTTSGSGYLSFATAETGTTYVPQFNTAGTYYVVCEATAFGNTVVSNEVEINVSDFTASIAPITIQNIFTNQPGDTLTVTEATPASAREWKYSTTSGSGYVSFATTETGTTYVPQFNTAGTYYVVCEATAFGNTVVTNEVEINVSDFTASIAPITVQNIFTNQAGDTLTVTEATPASAREWKYSTTSGSGYLSFATAETGTTYVPQFNMAGTYYVVCEATAFGNTVVTNEVEINVSDFTVSVTPSIDQNLIESQSGNTLTVAETPNATSREWKYSTTSGSGYVSFATSETGVNYTPNFATAGTYYVVCESTNNGFTVTSNEVKIDVVEFTVSVLPSSTQYLTENQVGSTLGATETPIADSREWKYSTTPGSGYVSFATPEIGVNYTPNFATAGTYYVVCESTIDNITVISNEVKVIVSVFAVSVTPSANQNLIEMQDGDTLTVTEALVVDSREWKYSTTSGSGYVSFTTPETGVNYTPNFATAGTYYVICESTIGNVAVISNEVTVNVATFTTSVSPATAQNLVENQNGSVLTVTETPTPDSREWKYSTTSGSGYVSFTTSETGVNYTPNFATAGTYYVVCESTIDNITVISNEVTVNVATFTTSVSPATAQNLVENQNGSLLTVTETPTPDSREWKYSTTSGSGYVSFTTPETGINYTPNFATAGTYYVVCESTIGNVAVISNEVTVNVGTFTTSVSPATAQNLVENQNGSLLTVTETSTPDSREWKYSTTSGSGYVSFTTSETGVNYTPNFATAGTYYVVCESTIDNITVISNEVTVNVATFTTSVSPATAQNLIENQNGSMLTVTETPTPDSREWKYSTTSGSGYVSFATPETGVNYTPNFATAGTYYVVCESTIDNITVISNEVKISVTKDLAVLNQTASNVLIYGKDKMVMVDLSNSNLERPEMYIYDLQGRLINESKLINQSVNSVSINVPEGVYLVKLIDEKITTQQKVYLR